ncbi:very-long-chain (3R)-3-hydroxyacyl-CoA dehydratase-like [Panonychus citri]|uniref:very-long-chain (3R)-3-hydroxyacyl-CoA dehydratase-like n=1 Tax=Panonychus citri TaxID=50023 RepID=UPI0023076D68|nr:very-long-chain (3R)-3-hydroxyacyl-CoA dehydratase-like [Panonychus citri]
MSPKSPPLVRLSTIYLFGYNLIQLIGFSNVVYYLCHSLFSDQPKGLITGKQIYSTISTRFIFFQGLQSIEIVHTLIGLTRGSPLIPLVQIGGRNLILHLCINCFTSQHGQWFVLWLLLVWSAIEIFRYSFYLTSIVGFKIKLITFLRYTIWVPLLPSGIILEAITIYYSVNLLETSGKWSISLPNQANFSFHLPTLCRLYLNLLIVPVSYLLLSHMYRQSRKALSSM